MSAKNKAGKKRVEFRLLQPNLVEGALRRECNGCTACCTVLEVPEVASPAFVPCSHLQEQGCGIYASRPGVCRKYYCEWAQGNAPLWMKPSECGVLPGHTADHAAMQLWELWPSASEAPQIRQFIRQSNERGIHVAVRLYPEAGAANSAQRSRVYLADGQIRDFDGLTFTGTVATRTPSAPG